MMLIERHQNNLISQSIEQVQSITSCMSINSHPIKTSPSHFTSVSKASERAMASGTKPLVFLAVVLCSSVFLANGKDFDFFFFTLMWPGAYCEQSNAGCCMPTHGTVPESDFYISGFSSYNITTQNSVTKCTNTPFYNNQINSLAPEIYEYWSSIKCPSNNGVNNWKSSWKSYGVCSGLDEISYFKAALDLRSKIDLLSILAKKGITPTYDLYTVDYIKSVIAEATGAKPLIQCSKGPFDKFQLFQVYICVAKDASTIIECPIEKKFTCGDDAILFHPFRKWMMVKSTKKINELPIYEDN